MCVCVCEMKREKRESEKTRSLPKLSNARQKGDRTIPDVSRVVDVLVAHLHLGVLDPQRGISVVLIQSSLYIVV